MGDAAAPRGLEEEADAATFERLDGVVREGRAQEVATHALDLSIVTAATKLLRLDPPAPIVAPPPKPRFERDPRARG